MTTKFVIGVALVALSTTFSYAQQIHTYDKKIEAAAAKRAGEKIGTLRGIILAYEKSKFILPQDMMPELKTKTVSQYPEIKRRPEFETVRKSLPPMVMKQAVDPIITGRAFAPADTIVKFNSKGEPLANHQDYPRPTWRSVAKSLIEAMDMNIYPGSS